MSLNEEGSQGWGYEFEGVVNEGEMVVWGIAEVKCGGVFFSSRRLLVLWSLWAGGARVWAGGG